MAVTCGLCLWTAALFPSKPQTLSHEGLRVSGASKEGDEMGRSEAAPSPRCAVRHSCAGETPPKSAMKFPAILAASGYEPRHGKRALSVVADRINERGSST